MRSLAVLLVLLTSEVSATEIRPMPRPQVEPVEVPEGLRPFARPGGLSLPTGPYGKCLVALRNLGMEFEEISTIGTPGPGRCGVANPVRVSAVAPGVALTPPARLGCATARALGDWTADSVLPAVVTRGGGRLTALRQVSGYSCRRINNRPTGRLSEHAKGNAIDIGAFRFSDDTVSVRARRGTADAQFQARVREGACDAFRTVLGPGTDAAHADHFHFDIAERRNGARYCR